MTRALENHVQVDMTSAMDLVTMLRPEVDMVTTIASATMLGSEVDMVMVMALAITFGYEDCYAVLASSLFASNLFRIWHLLSMCCF
jgi:hypothetical protein